VAPPTPPEADLVLIESTYGDRTHDDAGADQRLCEAIARTADRGGVVVIPAFAVDRTEVLLMALKRAMRDGRVPQLPVHVDSPMALEALNVYRSAIAAHDDDVRPDLRGDDELFDPGDLHEARDVAASKAINGLRGPAIVISASGMATGGRVLHHLASRLPDARNCVVLPGYQAVQTRGRRLLEGAKAVKMLGRYVPVRAEIVDASGFSVHADRNELRGWLASAPRPPECCFLVHGEPDASRVLRDDIERELGWAAVVAKPLERVRIDAAV
jgi:metallo-beta-lactamase family protein